MDWAEPSPDDTLQLVTARHPGPPCATSILPTWGRVQGMPGFGWAVIRRLKRRQDAGAEPGVC